MTASQPSGVLQPAPETAERVGVFFVVHGAVTIFSSTVAVRCGQCGQDTGPWLVAAYPSVATMTCRCGQRGSHRDLTSRMVETMAEGFEAIHSSLDAAEAALGFTTPR